MRDVFGSTGAKPGGLAVFFPTGRAPRLLSVLCLMAAALLAAGQSARAETEQVEVAGSKPDVIDVIAAYDMDSCVSLLSGGNIKSPSRNGRVTVESVRYKLKEGVCRGKTVNILVVTYGANRGFRGEDKASISYKGPPTFYTERDATTKRTKTYKITVK